MELQDRAYELAERINAKARIDDDAEAIYADMNGPEAAVFTARLFAYVKPYLWERLQLWIEDGCVSGMPWCQSCQSWHHRKNPTCVLKVLISKPDPALVRAKTPPDSPADHYAAQQRKASKP